MKTIGIYKITSPSGKVYVGQSRNIEKRISYYRRMECVKQTKLYNSIKKYGWENHSFEIIEKCSIEQLNNRERYYQDLYRVISSSGLNCILTKGKGLSFLISKETRLKMRNSRLGKKMNNISIDKIKQKTLGVPKSENHKQNISIGKSMINTKIILNLVTGIYYMSLKEASMTIGCSHKNLHRYLNGTRKNKTNFIYT